MDNNKGFGVIGLVIICIMAFFLWSQNNDISELREALSEANSNIEDANSTINTLNSNIDEANSTIEDLNSQIEDAQGNAWADYDTMGQSLDNLNIGYTVENDLNFSSEVSDPTQNNNN